MNKLQILKITLLICILAEEIKRVNKSRKINKLVKNLREINSTNVIKPDAISDSLASFFDKF